MEKKNYLAYCGLYCELCSARNRTPYYAKKLLETLKDGEFEEWGQSFKEFEDFWKLLAMFAHTTDDMCCKTKKCGHPNCAIRNCAINKKVEACAFCDEFPCEKITGLDKTYPLILHDGNRIKEIGIEAWISEQEKRKARGFSYEDIRCGKPDIPVDSE
jgi:hypothetical protein